MTLSIETVSHSGTIMPINQQYKLLLINIMLLSIVWHLKTTGFEQMFNVGS